MMNIRHIHGCSRREAGGRVGWLVGWSGVSSSPPPAEVEEVEDPPADGRRQSARDNRSVGWRKGGHVEGGRERGREGGRNG